MVSEKSKSAINIIESWAKQHAEECTIKKSEDTHSISIKIIPNNLKASQLLFRISRYGKFEFGVGSTIYFEELECEGSLIIDICEAVRN